MHMAGHAIFVVAYITHKLIAPNIREIEFSSNSNKKMNIWVIDYIYEHID